MKHIALAIKAGKHEISADGVFLTVYQYSVIVAILRLLFLYISAFLVILQAHRQMYLPALKSLFAASSCVSNVFIVAAGCLTVAIALPFGAHSHGKSPPSRILSFGLNIKDAKAEYDCRNPCTRDLKDTQALQ